MSISVARLSAAAERFYDPNQPFHNFDHAREVSRIAGDICGKLIIKTPENFSDLIQIAASWHDAGHHEDECAQGFDTKEDYSVQLAQDNLTTYFTPSQMELISNAIRGTIARKMGDQFRVEPEQIILHFADISAGIGRDWDEFLQKTEALRQERIYRDAPIDWQNWQKSTAEFLRFSADEIYAEQKNIDFPLGVGSTNSRVAELMGWAGKLLVTPSPR